MPALLGNEHFKTPILIERAHRSQATKPAKAAPPRPFIARLHCPQTRDLILKLARQKFPLNYNRVRVSFYPDLTLEVRNQRKECDEVRNKCRAANIRYGFLFPARFKVNVEGSTGTFDNPKRGPNCKACSLAEDTERLWQQAKWPKYRQGMCLDFPLMSFRSED
jgi:hypothetical protein